MNLRIETRTAANRNVSELNRVEPTIFLYNSKRTAAKTNRKKCEPNRNESQEAMNRTTIDFTLNKDSRRERRKNKKKANAKGKGQGKGKAKQYRVLSVLFSCWQGEWFLHFVYFLSSGLRKKILELWQVTSSSTSSLLWRLHIFDVGPAGEFHIPTRSIVRNLTKASMSFGSQKFARSLEARDSRS